MATQSLETIPEETKTPAPAPAPVRVTADPPTTKPATAKNPGRVASGKRLAERNRLVREAKKKAEAEAASAAAQPSGASAAAQLSDASAAAQPSDASATTTAGANNLSLMTVLGVGGLIVSVVGVYYQREAIMNRFKSTPQAATPPAPTPAPSRIPVKSGLRKME